MIAQCCICGGKVCLDDSHHEEIHNEKFSQFSHVLCWDTKQTIERKVRAGNARVPQVRFLHQQMR